jgi:hypothetical protein
MSLVRLLTAGKSLTDLKNSTSSYRMRQQGGLPRFAAKKNPFRARSETPAVAAAPGAITIARPSASPPTPAEAAAASLKQTVRLPAAPAKARTGSRAGPGPAARTLSRVGHWMRKLNPLAPRAGRKSASRPAAEHPPVQGELSLDNVKVVRNDLNDADVEVIAAGTKGKPGRPAGGQVQTESVEPRLG